MPLPEVAYLILRLHEKGLPVDTLKVHAMTFIADWFARKDDKPSIDDFELRFEGIVSEKVAEALQHLGEVGAIRCEDGVCDVLDEEKLREEAERTDEEMKDRINATVDALGEKTGYELMMRLERLMGLVEPVKTSAIGVRIADLFSTAR
jgi:hypothetical protein